MPPEHVLFHVLLLHQNVLDVVRKAREVAVWVIDSAPIATRHFEYNASARELEGTSGYASFEHEAVLHSCDEFPHVREVHRQHPHSCSLWHCIHLSCSAEPFPSSRASSQECRFNMIALRGI